MYNKYKKKQYIKVKKLIMSNMFFYMRTEEINKLN